MDLSIDIEDYKLNIRAGGIIIHDNKVLVHKSAKQKHYVIVGGRIQIGEDSEKALKREIMEEMGKEIEITGYISTIENFFREKGRKFHEIMFVHKAEFKNEEDKQITETIKNIEGKDYLQYEWLDLNEIDKYPIRPQSIKETLKGKVFPIHSINER